MKLKSAQEGFAEVLNVPWLGRGACVTTGPGLFAHWRFGLAR